MLCYNCNTVGHMARNCDKPSTRGQRGSRGGSGGRGGGNNWKPRNWGTGSNDIPLGVRKSKDGEQVVEFWLQNWISAVCLQFVFIPIKCAFVNKIHAQWIPVLIGPNQNIQDLGHSWVVIILEYESSYKYRDAYAYAYIHSIIHILIVNLFTI